MIRTLIATLFCLSLAVFCGAMCSVDVTDQFFITTPTIYNPPGMAYYDKWRQNDVRLTNEGDTLDGPVYWTLAGLPEDCEIVEATDLDQPVGSVVNGHFVPNPLRHPPIINGDTIQLTADGGTYPANATRRFNVVLYEADEQPSYTSIVWTD